MDADLSIEENTISKMIQEICTSKLYPAILYSM